MKKSKDLIDAKKSLDKVIEKSRVHLYKPIQIAEILYHHRIDNNFLLDDLESYRSKSKQWRDDVSLELLGRRCTSSSKFQDDLFNDTAVPPKAIKELGIENEKNNGIVEAYIYSLFDTKHSQLSNALAYTQKHTKEDFMLKEFLDSFWNEPGLRRSIDKVYEVIVYALFNVLVESMELKVNITFVEDKIGLLSEFSDFTRSVLCLDSENTTYIQNAKVYRVGVTNAADRGLDMYSNWGPAIQIKHLSLNEELAESIVSSVSSDRIVIVCKEAEEKIIVSLLNQIGWKSKIQSIITEKELINWYEKALRGKYSEILGDKLMLNLVEELENEFPSIEERDTIITKRNYNFKKDGFWFE
ncbi:MAG: HaeII family restriction endonuclease [Acholeplasmatales bacterium]|nr:HaeII family restriction endonuclease [Acholeplasmatales bacterium]